MKMTYQIPELSASDTEETSVDPRVLIANFLDFTEQSIAKTQALINKGQKAQAKYNQQVNAQPQPLQPLVNDSNLIRK